MQIRINQSGFSLLGVAIGLAVFGLFMSAFVALVNNQVIAKQDAITAARQQKIISALIDFARRNHRLPCPANRLIPLNQENDGVEATDLGVCTSTLPINGVVSSAGVTTGVIPWASIGLSPLDAIDAYGTRFTYKVTLSLTAAGSEPIAARQGLITAHSASPGNVSNQINRCEVVGSFNPCLWLATVISHGPNGFGGYTNSGIEVPFPDYIPNDADEKQNPANSEKVIKKLPSTVTNNPYDDVVVALTSEQLISALKNSGDLSIAQQLTRETLDRINGAIWANSIKNRVDETVCTFYLHFPPIFVDYCFPGFSENHARYPLPTNIPNLTGNSNDPWGRNVQYVVNPLNYGLWKPPSPPHSIFQNQPISGTAYTLRSAGPDGDFGNGDDIVFTANVTYLREIFSKTGW